MNKQRTEKEISSIYEIVLLKKINKKELDKTIKRIDSEQISLRQYYLELAFSADFIKSSINNILADHSYYLHFARIKAVSTLLPAASNILDLGGANGSLYDMGYPHRFNNITIVDLPPDSRDPMYKDIEIYKKKTPNGDISVKFGDMSDLSFAENNSIDMVWSGESIEHIDMEAGAKTIAEAYRVLKPGGFFCLDTPNRYITEIHTEPNGGGFIHPEHKVEYYPEDLRSMLETAGFTVAVEKGICEMPKTLQHKEFFYEELVLGSQLSDNVKASYMQFLVCVKKEQAVTSKSNFEKKVIKRILKRISPGVS